jgi:uncharacterized protein YjbJ (UPF0337 family)
MNRHFEDTLYYLKRVGETAKKGVTEEVEPIEERVREVTGREKEPEPGRLQKIKTDLKEAGENAEGEAKEAIENAREALDEYRPGQTESN